MTNYWVQGINQSGKSALAKRMFTNYYEYQTKRANKIYVDEFNIFKMDEFSKISPSIIPNTAYIFDDFDSVLDKRGWNLAKNKPIVSAIKYMTSKCFHLDIDCFFITKQNDLNEFFKTSIDILIQTFPNDKYLRYLVLNQRTNQHFPYSINKKKFFASPDSPYFKSHSKFFKRVEYHYNSPL